MAKPGKWASEHLALISSYGVKWDREETDGLTFRASVKLVEASRLSTSRLKWVFTSCTTMMNRNTSAAAPDDCGMGPP
jgi:hypothetical protein